MAKKIFISGINTTLGFHIVEKLRKDHIMLDNYPLFYGTSGLVHGSEHVHVVQRQKNNAQKPIPIFECHQSVQKVFNINNNSNSFQSVLHNNDSNYTNQLLTSTSMFTQASPSIKIPHQAQQMIKCVLTCDVLILNFRNPTPQVQYILKVLKFYRFLEKKKITILGLSTHMTWASTKSKSVRPVNATSTINEKQNILEASINQDYWKYIPYNASSYKVRVPHPTYMYNYELEEMLLEIFQSKSKNVKGWILCPGILYGKQSSQLYEIIKLAIDGKSVTIFGDGENVVPVFNVDRFMDAIDNLVQNDGNSNEVSQKQKYLILSQNWPQSQKDPSSVLTQQKIVNLIKKQVGNKSKIIKKSSQSQIFLMKNELLWSSNVNFEVDQAGKNNIMKKPTSFEESISQTIEQFYEYCEEKPKQFYFPQQLNHQNQEILTKISQNFEIFDSVSLNGIIAKLVQEGILLPQSKQEQRKKKSPQSNSRRSTLGLSATTLQPNKIHIKAALQTFIKQKKHSNYVINLKKEYYQLISQEWMSMPTDERSIRLIVKKDKYQICGNNTKGQQTVIVVDSKVENQARPRSKDIDKDVDVDVNEQKYKQNQVELFSDKFYSCFEFLLNKNILSQADENNKDKEAKSSQKLIEEDGQINQKRQNLKNSSKQLESRLQKEGQKVIGNGKERSQRNIKNHTKKQSNLYGQKQNKSASLMTQYLLDNLVLYVVKAKQCLSTNKKLISSTNKVTTPQSQSAKQITELTNFLTELKQIRNRQNQRLSEIQNYEYQ